MAHTATAVLFCDIADLDGNIIFTSKTVRTGANISLTTTSWSIDDFEDDATWNNEYKEWQQNIKYLQEKYNANKKYMYALRLKEFTSDDEVENYKPEQDWDDFIILVKSEDIEDIEIDPSMYERCPDEAYGRMREAML